MVKLSVSLIFLTLFMGCSWHVKEYKNLKNVDISVGGKLDPVGAERDAQSFDDQVNKQFDSNVKLPRLPFHVSRYVDSLMEREGVMIFYAEGEF